MRWLPESGQQLFQCRHCVCLILKVCSVEYFETCEQRQVELIKGCDWNCYLDRYPKIRNEKWEQEKGNQDYARSHYLKFGRVAGKNCKCGPGPKNLITGASLLQLPILVEQEADESQQVVQQEMTVSTQQKPNYSWGKRFTHMCSRYRAASNAFEEYTVVSVAGRRVLNTRNDS